MTQHPNRIELRDGKPVYVCEEPDSRKPIMRKWVWPLVNGRQEGYGRMPESEIYAREAKCNDGHVSVYLGNGAYWKAKMPELGQTKAMEITETPIPRPRACRNRAWVWKDGKWQKIHIGQAGWRRELGCVVACARFSDGEAL